MEQTRLFQEDSQEKIINLKTNFSKQRAKDLTEHARKILIKDKEIEELKKESPRLEVMKSSNLQIWNFNMNFLICYQTNSIYEMQAQAEYFF